MLAPLCIQLCLLRLQGWLMPLPSYSLGFSFLECWRSGWLTPSLMRGFVFHPSDKGSQDMVKLHTQNACEEGCFPCSSDGWAMLKVVFIQVRFISGSCFLPYLQNRAKKSSCLQEFLCEGRSKVSWCLEGEWPPREALASPVFLAQLLWQGLWHMRLRKMHWTCCVFSDVL